MAMYCGIDLHSNNSYLAIKDGGNRDVAGRRLRNDLAEILGFLEPYRKELVALAVESTFNWYWLADGLKDHDYDVRLVNTTKASDYSALKFADDRHDARWIAHLMVLGILPEGYIMPRKERALRDLLRRRTFLVQKRTAHLASIKAVLARNTGVMVPKDDIQQMTQADVAEVIGDELIAESILIMLPIVDLLSKQITTIEKKCHQNARLRPEYQILKTAPGIGKILSLTIMCETGDISRFAKVGNFASYCRTVKSEHRSNQKKKGAGNRKNGNKHLSWAFSEVAHHAACREPLAKAYLKKKRTRSHPMVANRALANKMARACYYVLRDQVPFDSSRVFGK